MKAMLALQTIRDGFTRRRALWITPFAFAGFVAITSRRESTNDPGGEVTVVEFNDAGDRRGPVRLKRVVHSEAEWRKTLTSGQFYVTRRQSTDMAFTGTYYERHDPGLYRCICCGNALFNSETKFNSGTGWPSFWAPIAEENIRTRTDVRMFMERVEVRCAVCAAHLGHMFNDGPAPTNLRYCINESSLRFVPRARVY